VPSRGAATRWSSWRDAKLRQLVAEVAAGAPKSFCLAGDLGERDFAARIVDETVARCGRIAAGAREGVYAALEAIERGRHKLAVPRRNPGLVVARWQAAG